MRVRLRRSAVLAAMTGLPALFGGLLTAPVAQAAPMLVPVRQIGFPGHAAHYGWGQDTVPPGFPNAGDVLASDYWNFRVTQFAPDGSVRRTMITKGNRNGPPYDVAVNPVSGNIAVGDVDGAPIGVDIYSFAGSALRSCTPPGWLYPGWLDYDPTGRLVVSDSRGGGGTMYVLDDTTCAVRYTFGGGTGPSHVGIPRGVDFAPDGTLWVVEAGKKRVSHWRLDAASATMLGSFPLPVGGDFRGLLYNPANDLLYVVNAGGATVDAYTTAGVRQFAFGGRGTANGKFLDGGRGITRDGAGNLWVGDMPGFRTQKFTSTGRFLLSAPEPASPPPDGGFNQPGAVGVDADRNVFVADSYNWRIEAFDPAGVFLRKWGSRLSFNYPRGIAVDRRDGSVVVFNSDSQQVDKYTQGGVKIWTTPGVKGHSVAVDQSSGAIYAAQDLADKVTEIAPDGRVVRDIGTGMIDDARGVAVDPVDGSVWTSSNTGGAITHFAADGSFLGRFQSGIFQAADLEVDATTVYVASKSGHQIRFYSKSGVAQGAFGGFGSGLGQFNRPMGMDLIGDRLYVTEASGERVQELRITSS
jgi:tripartite motif-containing protein 71